MTEEELVKMIKATRDGKSYFSGSFGPNYVDGELKNNQEEYDHHVFCNGDRTKPRGTGICSCLNIDKVK